MQLVPITADDEDLAVRLECDPMMMRHIGGPRPEKDVRASHKRRLELMEHGFARMFKIVTEESHEVLGTIGIWEIDWEGPTPTKWVGSYYQNIKEKVSQPAQHVLSFH